MASDLEIAGRILVNENNQLKAENAELREKLKIVARALNGVRADIEGTLWPNNGFADTRSLG